MKREVDVAIVGGGPVGALLACALKGKGLEIALLEARTPAAYYAQGEVDLRVFAISPASRRMLEAVGAWKHVAATRYCPYGEMHVWDATGKGSIHFDCAAVGEPALGYIVENSLLQDALWRELKAAPDVSLVHPARIEGLSLEGEAATVTLDGGRRLKARLVVAADGAESATRKLAGIEVRQASYGQRGIVAVLRMEKPHLHTAWQRFLPTGPLAFLPLADGRVSIVWSAEDEEAERLLKLEDAAFCSAVTQASDGRLGKAVETGPRAAFPLQRLHAEEYVRARLALVGDAAHAVHPLAGQGVNLGFLDAASLAEVIADAHARERDIGDYGVLRRYARWRSGENQAMIFALDGFKRLFSNDIVPLSMLRNAGLSAVDRFTPLKRVLVRRAMGFGGDLPHLARANG